MGLYVAPMVDFFVTITKKKKLDRIAQLSIPNPWGIAFDEWGQVFYA